MKTFAKEKRHFWLVLSTVLMSLLCMAVVSGSMAREQEEGCLSVMTEQLQEALEKTTSRIPVAIWLDEISGARIEEAVKVQIGFNRQDMDSLEMQHNLTLEEVDLYISTERTLYKEEQLQSHERFLDVYAEICGFDPESEKLFVSKYAPLICAELTPAEIRIVSNDDRVQMMDLSPEKEPVSMASLSYGVTDSATLTNTLGFTGSGIKIGMADELLPISTWNLFNESNVNRLFCASVLQEDKHATLVAYLMVGQQTAGYPGGIVPDAYLYATDSTDLTSWKTQIEYLLDYGSHIIVITQGYEAANYNVIDQWFDHIGINHSVHFVCPVGNDYAYTPSPSKSYNSISVGAIDDKNTTDRDDDEPASFSCYVEYENYANKPDLMAPGVNIYSPVPRCDSIINIPHNNNSGTCFAAPQVAAIVAQLCEYRPALLTKQGGMKAILSASISHPMSYDTNDSEFDSCGAGVANAYQSYRTIAFDRYRTSYIPSDYEDTTDYYTTDYVVQGETVRVSLSWLKSNSVDHSSNAATATPSNVNCANLDLYVYGANHTLIESACSTYNNTEIVEFVAPASGYYSIEVVISSLSTATTYYGIAWGHQ